MLLMLLQFVWQHQQRTIHAPSSLGLAQFYGLNKTILKVLSLLKVSVLESLQIEIEKRFAFVRSNGRADPFTCEARAALVRRIPSN